MDTFIDGARNVLLALLPAVLVFGLVSLAAHRRSFLAVLVGVRRGTATNLALIAINSVLLAGVIALATDSVHLQLRLFPAIADFWLGVPQVMLLLLALLIDEFVVYWRHRTEHHPVLWPIHATHHSDEAMTWLTLFRKHPLSHLFGGIIDGIPLILLGFPAWAVAASALIRTWWGYFIHADLPWTLGVFGKVVMSPAAHRLHHIDDEDLMGQNFGGFFSIYDRMFGTFDDASAHLRCKTGITGGARDTVGELARPFEAVVARLRRRETSPA